jgi:hypothetical protein
MNISEAYTRRPIATSLTMSRSPCSSTSTARSTAQRTAINAAGGLLPNGLICCKVNPADRAVLIYAAFCKVDDYAYVIRAQKLSWPGATRTALSGAERGATRGCRPALQADRAGCHGGLLMAGLFCSIGCARHRSSRIV